MGCPSRSNSTSASHALLPFSPNVESRSNLDQPSELTADCGGYDPKNVQGCAIRSFLTNVRNATIGPESTGGVMASNLELASLRAGSARNRNALRWHRCTLALIVTSLLASSVAAQLISSKPKGAKGTGNKAERASAIATIPFAELVPTAARQIREVVDSPSVYRKLPTQTIQCDRDFFVFLVRNPETVVHTWQQMGITALSLDRVGAYQFESSDGAGTDSQVELVYGTPGLHVFYGTGVYEGPLLKKKLTGQCVLVLRSEFGSHAGKPITKCRLDVFIRLPQSAVDVLAKTLHPLFGKAADVNFTETAKFFERLHVSAVRDPDGIDRLASRLDGVSPDVRQQMVKVAHDNHNRWHQSASVQQVSGTSAPSRGSVQRISRHPAGGPMLR